MCGGDRAAPRLTARSQERSDHLARLTTTGLACSRPMPSERSAAPAGLGSGGCASVCISISRPSSLSALSRPPGEHLACERASVESAHSTIGSPFTDIRWFIHLARSFLLGSNPHHQLLLRCHYLQLCERIKYYSDTDTHTLAHTDTRTSMR